MFCTINNNSCSNITTSNQHYHISAEHIFFCIDESDCYIFVVDDIAIIIMHVVNNYCHVVL